MDCGNLFGGNFTKINNSQGRFFKYKFAESLSVPVIVCEELLSQDSVMQLMKLTDEIYFKLLNIKFEYVPIPYAELTVNGTSIVQIENMTAVIFPVELSNIANDDFWYHSPVFFTSELLLITGPPAEVKKYSMSFLTLDNTVSYSLLLCIVILPLLAKLSEFVTNTGQGRRQEQTSIRQKVRNYLNFSWDFVCVFFFEPFLRVPKCISWRFTIGSWLIAILIISIFMGSSLKTELYSTEHVFIDSLESFSKYTNAKIRYITKGNAAGFLKEWEKSIMETQPKLSLASRVEYVDAVDFLDADNYRDVFLGRGGIFILQFFFDNLMSILLEGDADFRNSVLYFNAERIKNLLFVFPFSSKLKMCPEFIEQISLIVYVLDETKLADHFLLKNQFYISRIVWKKPTKRLSALTINETYGTFLLFFYGLGIATVTFISEIVVKWISSCHSGRL